MSEFAERFGNKYWGIRIVRNKKPRLLYVYADRAEIQDGDLLLYGHAAEEENVLFRAVARGSWTDFFAASCFTGNEMTEDHDIDEITGEDACRR